MDEGGVGQRRRDVFEQLEAKIKVLNAIAWEGRCDWPTVNDWLQQFTGASGIEQHEERMQMLFLLSNFIYFGSREVRELLRALYRDVFRYRIIAKLRRENGNTTDRGRLRLLFDDELRATRFLPVGNPSESGCHLLYFFRQENQLGKKHFIHTHEIFEVGDMARLRDPTVKRYVFLDDFCGSGQQGTSYCRDIATPLKTHHPHIEVSYYVLYASIDGLNALRSLEMFDEVDCVFELDETFKAFSDNSLFYRDADPLIARERARQISETYGRQLTPSMPLGYRDGQLLLGFSHNVPDNTLPVFWYNESDGAHWFAIFPRYPKSYEWGEG